MARVFPIGVLARTEPGTRIPFLDDLSHHMLVVASANLATSPAEAVLASLMHDMFKGLMIWNPSAGRAHWLHLTRSRETYEHLIPPCLGISAGQVSELIRLHHDRQDKGNPIRHVETRGGAVTALESRFIIDQILGNTKSLVMKLSGRYRWLLACYVHRLLKQQLTTQYGDRLESVLGVRQLHYHYIPVSASPVYKDIDARVRDLDLNALRIRQDGEDLHIYLPVSGLREPMTIIYGCSDSVIAGKDSLQLPLGEALAMMAFDGTSLGKARVLYVDAGFTITLDDIIAKCLQAELKKPPRIQHSASEIARSLEGTFKGPARCSFCGEQARSTLRLKDTSRFTSIPALLDPRLNICPACAVGFELEEQLRAGKPASFMIPMPALVDRIELAQQFSTLSPFIRGGDYLMSLSGELWLQILSVAWYQEYQQKADADYVLDPRAALLPLEMEFTPQATYPLLQSGPCKKFALESSLSSSLVLPAKTKDIDADEFRALRQAYGHLGDKVKATSFLKRLRQIYQTYI